MLETSPSSTHRIYRVGWTIGVVLDERIAAVAVASSYDWTGASWDVENVEERKTISVSISWYALVGFGVAIPSPNIFFVYSSRFLNYSP